MSLKQPPTYPLVGQLTKGITSQVRQHNHLRRKIRPSQRRRSRGQGDREPEEERELPRANAQEQPGAYGRHLQAGWQLSVGMTEGYIEMVNTSRVRRRKSWRRGCQLVRQVRNQWRINQARMRSGRSGGRRGTQCVTRLRYAPGPSGWGMPAQKPEGVIQSWTNSPVADRNEYMFITTVSPIS